MSSEFLEIGRQLSGLKCSGFITEEAYAAQIALIVADVVPDSGGAFVADGVAARHAGDDSGAEREWGKMCNIKCGPKASAQNLMPIALFFSSNVCLDWVLYATLIEREC